MAYGNFDQSEGNSATAGPVPTFAVARFAIVFGLVLYPALCAYAAIHGFAWASALPIFTVHALIPIFDLLIRSSDSIPFNRDQASGRFLASWAFDWPVLCLPAWLICLFSTLWFTQELNGITWLAMIVSLGTLGGILAINPAHELIHRRNPRQRYAGGVLLAAVCYGAFKIEHVRGHHRWVGTDKDKASAKRGQTIFSFAPISVAATFIGGFKIEQQRLRSQQLAWYRNEYLLWTVYSFAFAGLLFAMAGWQAVGGFVLASAIAILELELINYIEHYGLRRRQLSSGEMEPVTELHSWNCSSWLVDAYLFNLQKHSDHHAHPGREYLFLRDMPQAPQLPSGYASLMLACLVPPLWFKLMHPRLDALATTQANQSAAKP